MCRKEDINSKPRVQLRKYIALNQQIELTVYWENQKKRRFSLILYITTHAVFYTSDTTGKKIQTRNLECNNEENCSQFQPIELYSMLGKSEKKEIYFAVIYVTTHTFR